ncbi:MAG: glycosyltransferase involved in cell wall biosynthesis [Parasphingorhabdus sp.]|jgi:glycosyltransferase involved in cell wall biosynthesis
MGKPDRSKVTYSKKARLINGIAKVQIPLEPTFDFVGNKNSDKSIQFYGPLRDPVSMSQVSAQICLAVIRRLGPIAVQNYTTGGWQNPSLQKYEGVNVDAPVAVFYGVPDHVPESVFNHKKTIGGFVCETDHIQDSWVAVCNRFDLIIVPSNWCRQAFLDSGVLRPIMVVAHGLEDEYRPNPTINRPDVFTFYNTFHASSFSTRKSLEELVRTFLRTFGKEEKVMLRLRTESTGYLTDLKKEYEFGNRIWHDANLNCNTQKFADIYSEVHCTVHPSKGEGFGFIPFQSIACGTPVIAPHSTGMADYLNGDNSIKLKTSGRVNGEGVGNAVGTYFAIDEDHLSYCMRYVVNHWETEYQKCNLASSQFRHQYSWENVLEELISCIDGWLQLEKS